ncbi:helix-turn-helix transcriptional regulator [Streptomyces sp.]|uniref:helix-turn-helix domain-containing protein n=1 Tax=Streptomyces sp. TaxID=1931 RepID=UPI0028128CD1|nr:helix-turn-helix transcriptional regulator [Streptomyces sp.]
MERPPATYQVHGPSLRRRRMSQGHSVQAVADAAGISRSYLQRLETGTRECMGPERYIRLRTALNATDDQILARTVGDPEER